MALVKRIAFTYYPVTDIVRARAFYEEGLGLSISDQFGDGWIEYGIEGGVFAITNMLPPEMARPASNAGGAIAFEVDDVDHVVGILRARGAKVLVEPMATPVCRMAVLEDTEGNALTIHHVTD